VLLVLCVAATARAQPARTPGEAKFYEGRALLKEGRLSDACAKLAESQRLEPASGTMALLGLCHERQGKTATAWREYLSALELARAEGQTDREELLRSETERLRHALSTLRIDVAAPAPSGLVVLRNGETVSEAEWGTRVPVDPGTVTVEARAPGHASWRETVDVGDHGAAESIRVPDLDPTTKQPMPLWPWGVAALGVGAVAVGVGSYFGARAISLNDDSDVYCDADNRCNAEGFELRNDARSAATGANVAFAIGAVSVAVGVVLLIVDGLRDDRQRIGRLSLEF